MFYILEGVCIILMVIGVLLAWWDSRHHYSLNLIDYSGGFCIVGAVCHISSLFYMP